MDDLPEETDKPSESHLTIEEKILKSVVAALKSSHGQLDLSSKNFYVGLRRSYAGSDMVKFCKIIHLKQKSNLMSYTPHPLFFEELADSFAGIKTQSTIVYVFSLGLQLATAYLVLHTNGQTASDKKALNDVPEVEDTTVKQEISIDANKWINMLDYMLKAIKEDDVIKACFEEDKISTYQLNAHDFALVSGILKALEAFTNTWRENIDSTSQIDAFTKAVSELEKNVETHLHMISLKRKYNEYKPVSRKNPAVQILATAFQSILEAIKCE